MTDARPAPDIDDPDIDVLERAHDGPLPPAALARLRFGADWRRRLARFCGAWIARRRRRR